MPTEVPPFPPERIRSKIAPGGRIGGPLSFARKTDLRDTGTMRNDQTNDLSEPDSLRGGLPSWIPENLLRATAAQAAKAVAEDPRRAEIMEKVRVSPGLSSRSFYDTLGIENPKEFKGKRVVDLGGGFGGLAEILMETGAKVTVADPVFLESDAEIGRLYRQDLERAERRLSEIQEKLRNPANPDLVPILKRNLAESRRVLEGMRFWLDYSPEAYPEIDRLGAYAERLGGIADGSQDAVFIANVATKPTVDPAGLVRELDRILAPGGRVFIGNDAGEEEFPKIRSLLSGFPAGWKVERDWVVRTYFCGTVRKP